MANLLADAAEWFKARETPIRRWYDDDRGRYAFAVTVEDQPFIVTAKKSLYHGKASFMERKVVERAQNDGALVLLFAAGRRLVFDPDTIFIDGSHDVAADDSRAKKGERWVDIDANRSVGFQNWFEYGEEPPNPTKQTSDVQGTPDKPWDVTAWGDS